MGRRPCRYYYVVAIAVVLSFSVQLVQCQVVADDYSSNPVYNLTQVVYAQLSNLTSTILNAPFTKNAGFCIKDPFHRSCYFHLGSLRKKGTSLMENKRSFGARVPRYKLGRS